MIIIRSNSRITPGNSRTTTNFQQEAKMKKPHQPIMGGMAFLPNGLN